MAIPTLRQLEYLMALSDAGSFSLAAEHCCVTQSTLSTGISELENILGETVVQRGRRKNTLTPFGQHVCDQARNILRHIDEIMAKSRSLKTPLSGLLRLGVIPTIAPYMLPKILPGLQRLYPELELQLHEDLTERLLEQLRQGRLDIVLMAFPFETPGMEQHILFKEDFFAAFAHGDKHPDILTPGKINPENLLLLDDGHCLRDHALSACSIQPTKQRKTFSATSLPTLIQMVANGYGFTLLPAMATGAALPPGLKLVRFRKPVPAREIGLCWAEKSPKIRDFTLLATTLKELHNS